MAKDPRDISNPFIRPRILCLHGRGCSAEIFQVQARRIAQLLEPRFELIYIDGLYTDAPGPGVLPVFEDMGPYFKWSELEPNQQYSREVWLNDWEKIRKKLLAAIVVKGPFVGVMGFSQGAKVAATLLQYEQSFGGTGLRFGILAGGTYPPFNVQTHDSADQDHRIKMPTVHVHGLSDPWRPRSLGLLRTACDENSARVFEFQGGHHFPLQSSENEELAEMILETYNEIEPKEIHLNGIGNF